LEPVAGSTPARHQPEPSRPDHAGGLTPVSTDLGRGYPASERRRLAEEPRRQVARDRRVAVPRSSTRPRSRPRQIGLSGSWRPAHRHARQGV